MAETHAIQARFQEVCDRLNQENPPVKIEWILDNVRGFRISHGAEGHKELNETVDRLVNQFDFEVEASAHSIYDQLSHDAVFLRAAVLFVGADYNWFKHRPMGYSGTGQHIERPPVHYAYVSLHIVYCASSNTWLCLR